MNELKQLHPTFGIPPGIEDVENYDPDDGWIDEDVNAADDGDTSIESDDESDIEDDDDDSPDAVTHMSIVKQTLRLAEDGHHVVDLVLEVEDIPGVVKYDVRETEI